MKLLLDTHTYIWFYNDKPELSPLAKRMIESEENFAYLSIVSLWEMSIKVSLGKLELNKSLSQVYHDLIISGIEILPIAFDHILSSSTLPFHHRDPFDRLIVAQALTENMQLLSADTVFDAYTTNRTW